VSTRDHPRVVCLHPPLARTQGSRVDINLLGLAADPWIDISPPRDARVRPQHGPHHAACRTEGLIVCHNGAIAGHQGGSTDFMMKVGCWSRGGWLRGGGRDCNSQGCTLPASAQCHAP
jgi:hypothetical protein